MSKQIYLFVLKYVRVSIIVLKSGRIHHLRAHSFHFDLNDSTRAAQNTIQYPLRLRLLCSFNHVLYVLITSHKKKKLVYLISFFLQMSIRKLFSIRLRLRRFTYCYAIEFIFYKRFRFVNLIVKL